MKIKFVFIIFGVVISIFYLFIPIYGHIDNLSKCDVAIVLGNQVHENGELSKRLKSRMDKCIYLYNKGLFKKIIVSGAIGKEGVDEAIAMKKYLIDKNISENLIIVDSNGKNTFKTAVFTLNYVKMNNLNSVLVISQYYHMYRSKMILKKLGLKNIYRAHSDFYELRDIIVIGRELMAILKYFIVY